MGNDTLTLEEIAIRLGVVMGNINRQARTKQETGNFNQQELKKEMGNIIYSMIRWCDDLGYDPQECIKLAQQAQQAYAKKSKNYPNNQDDSVRRKYLNTVRCLLFTCVAF